ncbi:MAG: alpha/beta hydrolase [Pseudomonadota bacterium]
MKRSLSSYLVNGVIRLTTKRRPRSAYAVADIRRRFGKVDSALVRPPADMIVENVDLDGLAAEWVSVAGASEQNIVYYLHGGGFVMRAPNTHKTLLTRLSRRLGCKSLMPDYRLAPEHPFPAAPEDCLAGYRWLLDNGATPKQIVIAGDSAGGCLTLATLHLAKQAGLPMPACAVLISPCTDLTMSSSTALVNERSDPMFTLNLLLTMRNAYVRERDIVDPAASPLFADFSGFPPLQILVGSSEILLSDAERTAERARLAGVETELEIWDGMPHVFPAITLLAESGRALDTIADFVHRHAGWQVLPR